MRRIATLFNATFQMCERNDMHPVTVMIVEAIAKDASPRVIVDTQLQELLILVWQCGFFDKK